MITQKKYMPLLAGVMMLFSAPAMAGTFVSDICLQLNNAGNPNSTKLRVGVTSIGSTHFQLNGVGQFFQAGIPTFSSVAVSGSADMKANGDFIMSLNWALQLDPLAPTTAEIDAVSIFLPAGGGVGNFSNPFVNPGFLATEVHGTAAIVSCVGIGI